MCKLDMEVLPKIGHMTPLRRRDLILHFFDNVPCNQSVYEN